MRRCGDIQPNLGPTQSAAPAAAATADAHPVRQSRNRLQREADHGMLRDREHAASEPAQKCELVASVPETVVATITMLESVNLRSQLCRMVN